MIKHILQKELTMKLKSKACGAYSANCYILECDGKEFIIDPGMEAASWVKKEVKNPVAILNTHGHFDHVWDNAELKREFNIPIYAPKGDCFMLEKDPFSQGTPPSIADIAVEGDATLCIEGVEVKFFHFPGHTPGCSVILIGNMLFSGDFIFNNSIGRYDFPYSNAEHMRTSLEKFLTLSEDWDVYPGHGGTTKVFKEQRNTPYWLRQL
jgi:hydroxyacylglutathione hydrolase